MRPGPSPSRPSWSPCSATTTAATAPHLMAAVPRCPRRPAQRKQLRPTWHTARTLALGPAAAATTLARRPYDLRHAALSLWLNAGAAPAQIAQRAGHSIAMLLAVYTHCIDGQDDITNRQIERALHARNQAHRQTASGSANRRYRPDPVRHMSVDGPHSRARTADCQPRAAAARTPRYDHRLPFPQLRAHPEASSGRHERAAGPAGSGPRMAHNTSQRSAEPLAFQR